jgi:molybdopterin-guanine dinucleotide biosynthesis protein A
LRDSRDEIREGDTKLPVHGFVLAGGKSLRMGQDKALLPFCGRPMVEIAVEKLREFCVDVSIAGNREDLAGYAPVVRETWKSAGPAAGIEAGLAASRQEWALFIPVDVPLVPAEMLRRWVQRRLRSNPRLFGGAYLEANWVSQPTFCFLPRDSRMQLSSALAGGERKLETILQGIKPSGIGWIGPENAASYAPAPPPTALQMEFWFSNVNTPQELAEAEIWAQHRTA